MYCKDCLEEFLALKQAQGLSPRTIGDYRGIIGRFFKEPRQMHYLCCEEDTRIVKDIVKETTQENEDIFYDI